jgi:hypothetical protein
VQEGRPKVRSWVRRSEGDQHTRRKCGRSYIVSKLGAIK